MAILFGEKRDNFRICGRAKFQSLGCAKTDVVHYHLVFRSSREMMMMLTCFWLRFSKNFLRQWLASFQGLEIFETFAAFFSTLTFETANLRMAKQSIVCFQCVPILGRGFETGGYKCECKQGYEYPFEDPITYFDGQLMEAEFVNMVKDRETK